MTAAAASALGGAFANDLDIRLGAARKILGRTHPLNVSRLFSITEMLSLSLSIK